MKLKENELKIGNFVKGIGHNIIWKVEGIDKDFIFSSQNWRLISSFEGIEITEKLLFKCGFNIGHTSSVVKSYWIGENPITCDWNIILKWIDGDSCPFYLNGFHKIKYLHELQNLYFLLTREELLIREI